MPGGYPEGGLVIGGGIGDASKLPDMHFASKLPLVDGVPLGSVKDAELDPIRARGYTCETTKAIRETIIARVLEGEIDPKKLPDSRLRVRYCAEKAGHNKVRIKVIDRQYITPSFVTKALPHDLQLLCRLSAHANIALPYDSFQTHTSVYLVSEQTPGVDVVSYMGRHGHREHEAHAVFSQVLAALTYAHSQDVVHRDLKPANVVVDETGHVKIHDLGLSPKLSVVQGQQLHEATKRAYMSPEVIKSRRYESKEADIYSLGVLLYDMLHGCTPYCGQKADMLQQIRLRAVRFYPRVSKDAKNLIRWMLHPDPWKRPTMAQLAADPWVRGIQLSPVPPKVPKSESKSTGDVDQLSPSVTRCSYAQATVRCGGEHVMLRSRIPDRKTAYAMDVDFPKMCTKLQPQCKTKPNPPKLHPAPRTHTSANAQSEQKMAAPKDSSTINELGKSADELKQVRSIESTLHVRSITKPQTSTSPVQIHEAVTLDSLSLNSEEVFGSRPLSVCSSASVMAFDHAESEFCYADSAELAEQMVINTTAKRLGTPAIGVKKRKLVPSAAPATPADMPPLTFTSPATQVPSEYSVMEPNSPSSYIMKHPIHDIKGYDDISSDEAGDGLSDDGSLGKVIKDFVDDFDEPCFYSEPTMEVVDSVSEVLTAVSFKSERASTVPTDLGSMEPWMGIQYQYFRPPYEEEINLTEVMQLPGISKEEHVSQFLSTVLYDDTFPEPRPACHIPAPPPRKPNPVSTPVNTYMGRRVLRPAKCPRRLNTNPADKMASLDYLPPIRGEAIPMSPMGSTMGCMVEQPPGDCASYTTEGGSSHHMETDPVTKELVVSLPTEHGVQETGVSTVVEGAPQTQADGDCGSTQVADDGIQEELVHQMGALEQAQSLQHQQEEGSEQYQVADQHSLTNYSTQVQLSAMEEPTPHHLRHLNALSYRSLTDLSNPMTVRHAAAVATPPLPPELSHVRYDDTGRKGDVGGGGWGGGVQGMGPEGLSVLKGVGLSQMKRGRNAQAVVDRVVPYTQSNYTTSNRPVHHKALPANSAYTMRSRTKGHLTIPRPPKPTKPISLDLMVKGDAPKLRYNHKRTPVIENHRPCRKMAPATILLPNVNQTTLAY